MLNFYDLPDILFLLIITSSEDMGIEIILQEAEWRS
jgi:hypothetical protein